MSSLVVAPMVQILGSEAGEWREASMGLPLSSPLPAAAAAKKPASTRALAASLIPCDGVSPICPIEATLYGYRPTLGATALFAAIFAVNLVITLGLMVRSRLWSFQAWLSVGLIFEVIGYAGRLMMHQDPWK